MSTTNLSSTYSGANQQSDLPLTEQFEPTRKVFAVMVRVNCAGCGSTATIPRPARPSIFGLIPEGWSACWELPDGTLALWCLQCKYEGRLDRPPRGAAA